MSEYHVPIMLQEVIDGLNIKKDGVYVDCTVGGGGHAYEIAKRLKGGKLVAFDRDLEAVAEAKKRLSKFSDSVIFVHDNFKNAPTVLQDMGFQKIDGFLVDLGVSSHQIDSAQRGFSFVHDGELDMRMDAQEDVPTAKDVVNSFSYDNLVKIFREYGEEEFAKNIAKNIVEQRQKSPICTTSQLRDIVEGSMPKRVVFSRGGASKKVFQALRIEVNQELSGLDDFLHQMIDLLAVGGRGCVLTFHSLEDRIVKNCVKLEATDCICPPKTPICICGHKARVKLVNRKPLVASDLEQKQNSRSTSAKLRIFEKI